MMKVGLLTQYFAPEIGAPQRRLGALVEQLIAAGHEVHCITALPNYPLGRVFDGYQGLLRRERKANLRITRTYIYPTQTVSLVRRCSSYFSFVFSSLAAGLFVLPRLDYLITESPPLFLGISGYLLSRVKRCRWILNVSDLWPESAERLGVVRQGMLLRMAWKLESFLYRHAWMVTGQTKEIVRNIADRFPGVPVRHLPNGVDTAAFRPELRSEELHRELGEGRCVAIYAGLHGIAQGLEQILEAAELLRNEDGLRFVFVGDGPEKRRLKEITNDIGMENVRFLDACKPEFLPQLLGSADIALVPLNGALKGAVPSKLFEALGAGIPVILLSEGDAADLVCESDAGFALQPGDIAGLVKALRVLAENQPLRQRLGANGRIAAARNFDRSRISADFVRMLEGRMVEGAVAEAVR